ncbi:uncharacterized protein LOC100900210 [Galendromus occidentalis]|uniref:Uncharacterized protein LOC100900210 n=1 Tax=Galendromus occidentalis TaxID=34638 RepID=A0AAJ6QUK3_9ACAR|nr:uncharacterized protein LOC100900210 [Galendromus occidentalis]
MAWSEKLRFVVEPILFLSFMTTSIEISLVQQLIRRKVCLVSGMLNCDGKPSAELILEATPWIGAYNIALSSVTFVVGLWFGSWADKYGRKKMMVIPYVGSILSTLIFIIASIFIETTPLILMVSAVIIGLSSGTLGVGSTCFGIISVVTTSEGRSGRIAIMEAMIFTGGALGFYIAGYALPRSSFAVVFCLEMGVHLIGLAYLIMFIREPEESLEERQRHSTESFMSTEHLLSMYRTVIRPRARRLRAVLVLLIFSSFMLAFGMATASQLTYTRLTSPPVNWKPAKYSFYHAFMVFAQGSMLVIVLPLCLRFFGIRDTTTGIIGAVSRLLGLTGLAAATEDWMFYLTIAFFSFSEFAMPAVRSILSKIVDQNEKSQIFGLMGAQQSLAFVLTGIILLFPGSMTTLFPGFGMAVGAVFQIVPILTLLYLRFFLSLDEGLSELRNESVHHSGYDSVVDDGLVDPRGQP